jgi:plastocyanin
MIRGFKRPFALTLVASLILLAPLTASATDHMVTVKNFEFTPSTLTIQKGDTVIWEWDSGSHTVTSGASSVDSTSGDLFNSPSTSSVTTFQFTFDDAGDFPYYCIPHEQANMKASITVEEGTPVEVITWGRIKKIFENTRGTVGGMN